MNVRYLLLLSFLLSIISLTTKGATLPNLSLLDAIRYGYQRSLDIKEQKMALEIDELKYKIEELNLYIPNTGLTVSTSLNNTLTQRSSFDGTSQPTLPTREQRANMRESNSVALEINEFKIFNSFIDYDKLKATKLSLLQSKQNTADNIRRYVFSIVEAYFDLKTSKDLLENTNNKLIFSHSVLDLLELKRKTNPSSVSETDILFAKDQIFQAKKEIKDSEVNFKARLLTLNFLISADLEQNYNFTSNLDYRPLKVSMDKILSNSEKSPSILKSKWALNQSELTHKYTLKELLPLPKIVISGFKLGNAYNEGTSPSAGKIKEFVGNKGNRNNLDLSIGINWTIPFSGATGFFNELTYKNSYLSVERSKNVLIKARFENLNKFTNLYYRIKSDEEQIKDLQDRVKNSSLLLDEILRKSNKGQVDRKEVEDAIGNAITSNQSLLTAILTHFKEKTDLANSLGSFTVLGESVF